MKNKEDYWNGYLMGFIAGEGCFHINIFDQRNSNWKTKRKNKIKFEIRPEFRISLVYNDLESLKFVQERFKFGAIMKMARNRKKALEGKQFLISGLKRCKLIINLIDRYQFRGKKQKDYLLWKKAIKLIEDKKHLTKEGILEIASIRDNMNRIGIEGKAKNYRDYSWFEKNLN